MIEANGGIGDVGHFCVLEKLTNLTKPTETSKYVHRRKGKLADGMQTF